MENALRRTKPISLGGNSLGAQVFAAWLGCGGIEREKIPAFSGISFAGMTNFIPRTHIWGSVTRGINCGGTTTPDGAVG